MNIKAKLIISAAWFALSFSTVSHGAPTPKEEANNVFEMMGDIFQIKDAPPIDPATLVLAQKTVGKILPDGSIARIFSTMMDKMIKPIGKLAPEMSSTEIMVATGIYDDSIDAIDIDKRKAITNLLDPNRQNRMEQGMSAFTPIMNKALSAMEPAMREGLSRAYARRFNAAQLRELNQFFATPTGSFYASEAYALQADPEVMQSVFKALPKMIEGLTSADGGLAKQIEEQMKSIPKPKTVADLDDGELTKLAELMGVGVDSLKENSVSPVEVDTAIQAGDEFATVQENNNPYADETGAEPWYDETNWTPAARKKVKALHIKAGQASDKSSAADTAYATQFQAAVNAARVKLMAQGWKPEPVTSDDDLETIPEDTPSEPST